MINPPPNQQEIQQFNKDRNRWFIASAWTIFFTQVFNLLTAITASGTTAQRPTKLLWVGRPYFDTTLGYPIWYDGSGWVKSDGTAA
jgi:hypothetical protein